MSDRHTDRKCSGLLKSLGACTDGQQFLAPPAKVVSRLVGKFRNVTNSTVQREEAHTANFTRAATETFPVPYIPLSCCTCSTVQGMLAPTLPPCWPQLFSQRQFVISVCLSVRRQRWILHDVLVLSPGHVGRKRYFFQSM